MVYVEVVSCSGYVDLRECALLVAESEVLVAVIGDPEVLGSGELRYEAVYGRLGHAQEITE